MGSYQRVLLEYAKPGNYYHNRHLNQDERRLRWWKMEAYGNSQHKSTEFNLRRSHIQNRKLQLTLEKDVLFFTKYHGVRCTDIERKQRKLWREQLHRETSVGKSHLEDSVCESPLDTCEGEGETGYEYKRHMLNKMSAQRRHHTSLTNNHNNNNNNNNGRYGNNRSLPYSEASDYTVQRHYFDPSLPVAQHIHRSAVHRVESMIQPPKNVRKKDVCN